MIIICNVPDEVVKSVKMGTWCGSSVAEKMISNGIPLDNIRAKIEKLRPNLRPEQMTDYDYAMVDVVDDIVAIIDKYKAESEEV